MKFALLYQYDPTVTGPTKGEVEDWLAFDKQVRDAGIFVYEAGFHEAGAARTVRVRDGSAAVTDGMVQRPATFRPASTSSTSLIWTRPRCGPSASPPRALRHRRPTPDRRVRGLTRLGLHRCCASVLAGNVFTEADQIGISV